MCLRFRFDRFPLLLAFLLLGSGLGWPGPAEAVARWINVQPGSKEQLWLAAFSGFALGLALGLMVYELRARGISIALRRLTDLAANVDGRGTEETRRGNIKQELDSVRLMKMLRTERADGGQLEECITETIQQAIRELTEELGLKI